MDLPNKLQVPVLLAEAILPLAVVNAYGRLAKSSDSASLGHVVGMVETFAFAGSVAPATVYGVVSSPQWNWPPGSTLFLSPSGAVITTPPISGFAQQLGKVLNPTTILFAPEQPVLL